MKKILLIVQFLAAVAGSVFAQVPRTITYQANLQNAGAPLADGQYSITASIYTAETAGTMLFTETQQAAVVHGVATIVIGKVTSIPTSMHFDTTYFIGISINGSPELPRKIFTSMPYALHSALASGITATTKIPFTLIPKAVTLSGAAGGDLSGNYPAPRVSKLQSIPVASNHPAYGDALTFDGIQWKTVTLSAPFVAYKYGDVITPADVFATTGGKEIIIPSTGLYHFDGYFRNQDGYSLYNDASLFLTFKIAIKVNGVITAIKEYYRPLIGDLFFEDAGIALEYNSALYLNKGDQVDFIVLVSQPGLKSYINSYSELDFTCFKVNE
ncbi:MAG TPA: hypothetical protein VFO76_04605 [Candidatus Kapabacteria bacterium]|nr:hypothetical protein [Candidatus Kapabacteria bacterium]